MFAKRRLDAPRRRCVGRVWSVRRVRFFSCGTVIVAYTHPHPNSDTTLSDANSRTCAESYTRTSGTDIHCYWGRP